MPSDMSTSSKRQPASGIDEKAGDYGNHDKTRWLGSKTFHTGVCISSWIIISNSTILFNKWLIDSRGFHFPILLTCWHLFFATLATQILARTTKLLDSRKKISMSAGVYARAILPISIFYSISLVTSNMAYLYLSIPFIQILKTTAPAVMLFVAWAAGTANPTFATILNIFWVIGGVMLASSGEIQFSLVGFLYQMGGIVSESIRLIMIQLLLSNDGLKMDPLVGLYYFAPACCLMNFLIALPTNEILNISWQAVQDVGVGLLFLNALIAFMLNIASVCLIGQTSGLVMTLTGILKNILLVVVSVMIWNTQITFVQVVGYTIALAGLVYYSLGYEQLVKASKAGVTWTSNLLSGRAVHGTSSICLKTRRVIVTALLMAGLISLSPRLWRYHKYEELRI